MLDVGASIRRIAERILLGHASQLLHVPMLLNQVCQVNARNLGEFRAEENVRTQIVNAGNQPLEGELRHIRSQRELARHLAQFRLSKKRQRDIRTLTFKFIELILAL